MAAAGVRAASIAAVRQASYTLNAVRRLSLDVDLGRRQRGLGAGSADWIGPNGQLQTWQNGADAVFGGMPGVVSIFGQVSPHEITFGCTPGGYVLQAGADPAGDQIVLPSNGAVINVSSASTSGGEGLEAGATRSTP